jgi:hypothetical protein
VLPRRPDDGDVESFYAELLRVGRDVEALEALLAERPLTDEGLLTLLRRTVPRLFLEYVVRTDPWSRRPSILTAVITSPRAEKGLCLRLIPQLPWRSLATVAATPWLLSVLRLRAEARLVELLLELKLGERIALARLATRALLTRLIEDPDARVVEASLLNPRLTTDELLVAVGRDTASRQLLESCAASTRWRDVYALRLGLVLQPRTPLALALGQISSLTRRDLLRVTRAAALAPLVRRAAEHVLEVRARGPGPGAGRRDPDPEN